jgi:hypothetical protein
LAAINFEIKKQIAELSTRSSKGWKKELNLISWNGYPAKYDIRDWDSTHTKMGKGVTLTEEELKELYQALKNMFENDEVQINPSKGRNVEEEFKALAGKAPLFVQELKNLIVYMREKGYTEISIKNVLDGQVSHDVETALINEVESISSIYSPYYNQFIQFIKDLNKDQLELLFVLIENM